MTAGMPSQQPALDRDLLQLALAGDRPALNDLLEPWRRPLFGYIYRMVTHRQDAEDLLQEVQLRILEGIKRFRSRSTFKTWLFRIATNACIDHLRHKKRWRQESQIEAEQLCRNDEEHLARVVGALSEPGLIFEIREHISFCFSCVSRTLEPDEQAALFLRDVFEFSGLEAAHALGISEPQLRHRLGRARNQMQEHFDGLCQLVSKTGACWQCRALRELTPEENRGPDLVKIEVRPGVNVSPEKLFAARLEIVRKADLEGGNNHRIHDDFFQDLDRLEESL